jgi:hypothetical protein
MLTDVHGLPRELSVRLLCIRRLSQWSAVSRSDCSGLPSLLSLPPPPAPFPRLRTTAMAQRGRSLSGCRRRAAVQHYNTTSGSQQQRSIIIILIIITCL